MSSGGLTILLQIAHFETWSSVPSRWTKGVKRIDSGFRVRTFPWGLSKPLWRCPTILGTSRFWQKSPTRRMYLMPLSVDTGSVRVSLLARLRRWIPIWDLRVPVLLVMLPAKRFGSVRAS